MTDRDLPGPGRSALLLGATGLVGSHCLSLLLADDRYSAVRVLGRRSAEREHPKIEEHLVDFESLTEKAAHFAVNDVFCCLGTTIRHAGSQEAFRRIDVDYPAIAAELSTEAGADQFIVVSALGADPESRVFYNRMKGEMESRVRRQPLRAVWILRPALLLGDRNETRLGERAAEVLLRPFGRFMRGPFRRYRPVHARAVAATMIRLAQEDGTGGLIESDQIEEVYAVS